MRHRSNFRPINWLLTNRLLLLVMLSLAFKNQAAVAFELSGGLAALEESDDRSRPAAIIHMGFDNSFLIRGYFWGRSYGPVKQTDGSVTFGKHYEIFGTKSLKSMVGLSLMEETTTLKFTDSPTDNSTYTSSNIGIALGIHYEILSLKILQLSASWDVDIYPAGSAFIYLVTGRKQFLGLTAGMSL